MLRRRKRRVLRNITYKLLENLVIGDPMKIAKKLIVVLAILAVAATFVYTSTAEYWSAPEPVYDTAIVGRGDLELTIAASGKIKPKYTVEVGAQVSGQLKHIAVQIGDLVNVGDLLVEIDPTLAKARVEQSTAQLKELLALLDQQEARMDLAIVEASRYELLKLSSAIAVVDYEISVANLKIAEAELAKLQAQIEGQESVLNADIASLGYTKIYAPISGTVVELFVVEGQTLNANQSAPVVMRIADMSSVIIEAEISEADVLHIAQDQAARFSILGSDREWETSVNKILPEPEIVNDVVLYKALLDVENFDNGLLSEMTAQVFFIEEQANDVLTIPISALGENRRHNQRLMATEDRALPPDREVRDREMGVSARENPLRDLLKEYPGSTISSAFTLEEGNVEPVNILVGVKTRTEAEVIFGLAEGVEVLTGIKDNDIPPPDRINRDSTERTSILEPRQGR